MLQFMNMLFQKSVIPRPAEPTRKPVRAGQFEDNLNH